jgi:hypothetical protein
MQSTFYDSWLHKVLGCLAALSGCIWLGGTIVRAAIAFDLFVPGTLVWKPAMSAEAVMQTVRMFGITAFYTMVAYAVFIMAGGTLWLLYRQLWKPRGGLLVAGLLFLLYVPIEAAEMYYDVKLVMLIQDGGLVLANIESGKQLVLKRISVLGGAQLLAMLGYFTALLFLVVQPLRKQATTTPAEQSA